MASYPEMTLREQVVAELWDRYTGLPDDYRRYVDLANEETLIRVLELALDDAPEPQISEALGIEV